MVTLGRLSMAEGVRGARPAGKDEGFGVGSLLSFASYQAARGHFSQAASKQRGAVTLLGMLLATSIAIGALSVYFGLEQRRAERAEAEIGGVLVAQTTDALRRLLTMAPSAPGVVPGGTVNGVNWLKPPTCGGQASNPPQGFVPCSFGDNFWAPNFRTTITNVAGRWEARLTFVVPNAFETNRVGTIADYLAEKANTHLTATPLNAPAPGVVTPGFVTVMSNVPQNANDLSSRPAIMSNPGSPDFGRVVVVVSNDPSTDTFLRTDGTNQMRANLNLGGNDLINGRDLQARTATLTDGVTANRVSLRPGSAGASLGGACTSGALATDSNGQLLACQYGRWFPAGTQVVTALNQPCSRPGAYGELITDGTGMICQGGAWIPIQSRMGGIVTVASYVASHGSSIPKPNCSAIGASPRIYLTPKAWYPNDVSLSYVPPSSIALTVDGTPWNVYAQDTGANWSVYLASSGNKGGSILVTTACSFV